MSKSLFQLSFLFYCILSNLSLLHASENVHYQKVSVVIQYWNMNGLVPFSILDVNNKGTVEDMISQFKVKQGLTDNHDVTMIYCGRKLTSEENCEPLRLAQITCLHAIVRNKSE